MDINDIFEAARARGLTRSLRHFSYGNRVISAAWLAWATGGNRCAP